MTVMPVQISSPAILNNIYIVCTINHLINPDGQINLFSLCLNFFNYEF
jgi:hypothetical protein